MYADLTLSLYGREAVSDRLLAWQTRKEIEAWQQENMTTKYQDSKQVKQHIVIHIDEKGTKRLRNNTTN